MVAALEKINTEWYARENKVFENALVWYGDDMPKRWKRIANHIPGKTDEEVQMHYQDLVDDVELIESGGVAVPWYVNEEEGEEEGVVEDDEDEEVAHAAKKIKTGGGKDQKKAVPWSEEEHSFAILLFLLGLERYGREIGGASQLSRHLVVTRTPTQVASHAQKFYNRQIKKPRIREKRRQSIHDIRTIVGPLPQVPFPSPMPYNKSAVPVDQIPKLQTTKLSPIGETRSTCVHLPSHFPITNQNRGGKDHQTMRRGN